MEKGELVESRAVFFMRQQLQPLVVKPDVFFVYERFLR
jgi:hypothetical protein